MKAELGSGCSSYGKGLLLAEWCWSLQPFELNWKWKCYLPRETACRSCIMSLFSWQTCKILYLELPGNTWNVCSDCFVRKACFRVSIARWHIRPWKYNALSSRRGRIYPERVFYCSMKESVQFLSYFLHRRKKQFAESHQKIKADCLG